MRIVIEGHDLPGATFVSAGVLLTNVHVGVQVRNTPDQLIRADATSARWEIDVSVVADGSDFRGPAVHSKRGERFVYLTWGDVAEDGTFTMFRRAKLTFADIEAGVLEQATADGGARRVGLVDRRVRWASMRTCADHRRSAGAVPEPVVAGFPGQGVDLD